jgi:hypothetical protein
MDATSEIGKIQELHRSNINIVIKMVLFFKHVGKNSFEDSGFRQK